MVQVFVKALRGFVLEGKIVKPGDVVQVHKTLARQLLHGSQAVLVEAWEQPGPAIVTQDPTLHTQDPVQAPRPGRKPKD